MAIHRIPYKIVTIDTTGVRNVYTRNRMDDLRVSINETNKQEATIKGYEDHGNKSMAAILRGSVARRRAHETYEIDYLRRHVPSIESRIRNCSGSHVEVFT